VQVSRQRGQYLAQTCVFDAGDGLNHRIRHHGLIFDDHGAQLQPFFQEKSRRSCDAPAF
jgi:hypothetical protein